jgi:PAS domain S-box-containing protein
MHANSVQRYEKTFSNALVSLFVLTTDGIIREVNARAERQLGYSFGRLIGQSIDLLLAKPPSDLRESFMNTVGLPSLRRDVKVGLKTRSGELRIFTVRTNDIKVVILWIARTLCPNVQTETDM